MTPLKILLADDHTIVRKGLVSILENTPDIRVIAEAGDGREALNLVEKLQPELVLMDISMPSLNGLEATKQIKKRFPKIKVVILTMHINEQYIFELIKVGASGYVIKKAAPDELIMAIKAVAAGEQFFSPAVSSKIVKRLLAENGDNIVTQNNPLTSREIEVLQLIAEKHTNKAIASILFISKKTVEAHRSNIMKKLDLHSVEELIQYAKLKGIIPAEKLW